MVRQFARLCDAEMSEEFYRGAVQVFARIFRISCAFYQSARKERAQGGSGIHTANVIYLRAR